MESLVVPILLRQVGDAKGGRLSCSQVDVFLDKHRLVFDRSVLAAMFKEADYRREGSLLATDLKACIQGRYPKRKYNNYWRSLACVLLGKEEHQLVAEANRNSGRKKDSSSNVHYGEGDTPPKRSSAKSAKKRQIISVQSPSSEWQAVMQRTGQAMQSAAFTSVYLPKHQSPNIVTTMGIKITQAIEAEESINRPAASTSTFGAQTNTFQAVHEFKTFSDGLHELHRLATTATSTSGDSPTTNTPLSGATSTANRSNQDTGWLPNQRRMCPPGTPKPVVSTLNATLPPSAISFKTSALEALRQGLKTVKPHFELHHPPLRPTQWHHLKTLGQPCNLRGDEGASMCRTPRTRPTTLLHTHDYVTWGDYATSCPTAPGRWFNDYRSVPRPGREKDGRGANEWWCDPAGARGTWPTFEVANGCEPVQSRMATCGLEQQLTQQCSVPSM